MYNHSIQGRPGTTNWVPRKIARGAGEQEPGEHRAPGWASRSNRGVRRFRSERWAS